MGSWWVVYCCGCRIERHSVDCGHKEVKEYVCLQLETKEIVRCGVTDLIYALCGVYIMSRTVAGGLYTGMARAMGGGAYGLERKR